MRTLIARARSLWRGLRRPERLWAEMDEEMRFHLEMEAERLVRERGLDPREARRQAAIAFGGVEKYKEQGHQARGLAWVGGLSLDVRLAWRLLLKSPALTLVGGLGIAVAIAVGLGAFIYMHAMLFPRLPLEEGERIVALENWDTEAGNEERRSLHDFAAWRAGMRSVERVSAFRMVQHGLVTGDAPAGRMDVAEMTASAFQVTRVPPLLGRYLVEEDEREGAPHVAVIGYDLWQSRFQGDPAVVGRQILLGDTLHAVVGVMPPGFSFPMDHALWTALRRNPLRYGPREGPEIFVFGRLAPGATREQAQAELTAIGRRTAAASPATHARLRPQVLPYTYPLDDIQDVSLWGAARMQLFVSLLLIAIAANVSVLVYARTAMRRGEIAIRSALGASRRRIVVQLFIEALALSAGAAALGLVIARLALRQVKLQMEQVMPVGFWVDFGLRPATVLFAAGLAALAAVIVGVLPALQSTGPRMQADLRRVGGGAGKGLGRTWTALIVVQVAVAVAVLPTAANFGWREVRQIATRPTYPVDEFLHAGVGVAMELRPGMDGETYRREAAARFGDRMAELTRRLESEPAVAGVAFSASLAGRQGPLQVEGIPAPAKSPEGHWAATDGIDAAYLDLLEARLLTGRGFRAADRDGSGRAVIVSRAFVREVLGGGSALGRRLRFAPPAANGSADQGDPDSWHEIVGVVDDLAANPIEPGLVAPRVFYPVAPGQVQGGAVLVRVRGGDPAAFAPRLREITASLDAELRLGSVRALADVEYPPVVQLILVALLLVLASVVLLSAAGIHALMSFAVMQRRREIGIRAALGAQPRRLLASVFSRALGQLAAGAAAGCLLGILFLQRNGATTARSAALLLFVAALMLGAGVLATLGPARRGLRIQPMDALRED